MLSCQVMNNGHLKAGKGRSVGGWQLAWDRGTSDSCSCFDKNMVNTWYVCLALNKWVPPFAESLRDVYLARSGHKARCPPTQGLSEKPLGPLLLTLAFLRLHPYVLSHHGAGCQEIKGMEKGYPR